MRVVLAVGVLSSLVFLTPQAQAHTSIYTALLSGLNESPPNGSPALGIATVTMDLDLVTMRVEVSFSGLQGTVTSAHIHAATATPLTGTAGVATQVPTFAGFPSGVTSGTYDNTFDLTQASSYNPDFITASGGSISSALNALDFAMEEGRAYFNIHSSAFPGGEIRGFLVAAPEPGTLALLGLAAIPGSIFLRKRRHS